ncbi:MAG: hypothetical protein PHR35_16850, partial [Kiritimatiellae bacterium]|nr:hypothetical protein [Kiritimatiellia bacterium]
YSIVTEYTSFLVLENDAEFARWKIERRNERRTADERTVQARRQQLLESLRAKAAADLGPEAIARTSVAAAQPQASVPVAPSATPSSTPSPSAAGRSPGSVDFDFGRGSGPVGPLFVAAAAWLSRRRRRAGASSKPCG